MARKTKDPYRKAYQKLDAQYKPARKIAQSQLRELQKELKRLLDREPVARRTAQLKDAIARFSKIQEKVLGCMAPDARRRKKR